MTTFDEVLALAAPSETTVPLVLGGKYLEEIRQLEAQLAVAPAPVSLAERNPATVIAEQIAALQETMRGTSRDFALRSIGGLAWAKLKGRMPERRPNEDDETHEQRYFGWVCEMVAVTCVDPVMTADQVATLADKLPGSSWDRLSGEAWTINAGTVTVPFSAAAYAVTRSSGQA